MELPPIEQIILKNICKIFYYSTGRVFLHQRNMWQNYNMFFKQFVSPSLLHGGQMTERGFNKYVCDFAERQHLFF